MTSVEHGERSGYLWLWSPGGQLWDVVLAVPDLVVGNIVAVTACDSGPLQPTSKELASGWRVHGDIAYSPRLRTPRDLPIDGWDELYVLPEHRQLPALEVFVNYPDFTPDADLQVPELDPTWDRPSAAKEVRSSNERAERFWTQLLSVQPSAFLSEGNVLTCVSRDEALFSKALTAVRAAAS